MASTEEPVPISVDPEMADSTTENVVTEAPPPEITPSESAPATPVDAALTSGGESFTSPNAEKENMITPPMDKSATTVNGKPVSGTVTKRPTSTSTSKPTSARTSANTTLGKPPTRPSTTPASTTIRKTLSTSTTASQRSRTSISSSADERSRPFLSSGDERRGISGSAKRVSLAGNASGASARTPARSVVPISDRRSSVTSSIAVERKPLISRASTTSSPGRGATKLSTTNAQLRSVVSATVSRTTTKPALTTRNAGSTTSDARKKATPVASVNPEKVQLLEDKLSESETAASNLRKELNSANNKLEQLTLSPEDYPEIPLSITPSDRIRQLKHLRTKQDPRQLVNIDKLISLYESGELGDLTFGTRIWVCDGSILEGEPNRNNLSDNPALWCETLHTQLSVIPIVLNEEINSEVPRFRDLYTLHTDLKSKIARLEHELEEASEIHAATEERSAISASMRASKHAEELSKAEAEKVELEHRLTDAESALADARDRAIKQDEALSHAETEKTDLERKLGNAEKACNDAEGLADKHREALSKIEAEMVELGHKLEAAEEARRAADDLAGRHLEELTEAKTENLELACKLKDAEAARIGAEGFANKRGEDLLRAEAERADLERELKNAQGARVESDSLAQKQNERLDKVEVEKAELAQRLEETEKALTEAEEKSSGAVNNVSDRHNEDLSKVQAENLELEQKYEAVKSELEELKKLMAVSEDSKAKLQSVMGQLSASQDELLGFKDRQEATARELEEAKYKAQAEKSELEESHRAVKAELNELKESIAASENGKKALQSAMAQLSATQNDLSQLKDEQEATARELEEAKSQSKDMEDKLSQGEKDLNDQIDKNLSLLNQLGEVDSAISSGRKRIRELEAEVAALKADRDGSKEETGLEGSRWAKSEGREEAGLPVAEGEDLGLFIEGTMASMQEQLKHIRSANDDWYDEHKRLAAELAQLSRRSSLQPGESTLPIERSKSAWDESR